MNDSRESSAAGVACSCTSQAFLGVSAVTCLSHLHVVYASGAADVDFLAWLRSTVAQAAKAADEYQNLAESLQELRADIERQFRLTHVMVRCTWVLDTCLAARSLVICTRICQAHERRACSTFMAPPVTSDMLFARLKLALNSLALDGTFPWDPCSLARLHAGLQAVRVYRSGWQAAGVDAGVIRVCNNQH